MVMQIWTEEQQQQQQRQQRQQRQQERQQGTWATRELFKVGSTSPMRFPRIFPPPSIRTLPPPSQHTWLVNPSPPPSSPPALHPVHDRWVIRLPLWDASGKNKTKSLSALDYQTCIFCLFVVTYLRFSKKKSLVLPDGTAFSLVTCSCIRWNTSLGYNALTPCFNVEELQWNMQFFLPTFALEGADNSFLNFGLVKWNRT